MYDRSIHGTGSPEKIGDRRLLKKCRVIGLTFTLFEGLLLVLFVCSCRTVQIFVAYMCVLTYMNSPRDPQSISLISHNVSY